NMQSVHFTVYSGKFWPSRNKLVDRVYYPIKQLKNWTEARDYCRGQYTDLVSIRSAQEANRTSQLIVSDRTHWIGLFSKKGSAATWTWTDGEDVNYTHWKYMEPNDYLKSDICVAVNNGRWFDDYCNRTYQFMCYKGKIGKRDREYHPILQTKNWTQAWDFCRSHYTDLISIRDPEENKAIFELIDRSMPFWIGMYNHKGSDQHWMWTNGDKVNYTNWKIMEPYDYLKSVICVAMSNGQWFDNYCQKNHYTVSDLLEKIQINLWNNWKRWAEARNYCTTYYTDIISIRSTVENIFVSRLFSKETPLWLGLYKNNNTTTMWEWINGDKFIYTHWKDKEPNAQPGSVICVAMSNGQWFDNYCNQTYRFVCYKGKIRKESLDSLKNKLDRFLLLINILGCNIKFETGHVYGT
uniref:C-type lectin domain-containing protein n=1 Tax=Callorhinchus milii TaxID=7868 RepID=A0A4W3IDL3_CALMI